MSRRLARPVAEPGRENSLVSPSCHLSERAEMTGLESARSFLSTRKIWPSHSRLRKEELPPLAILLTSLGSI